MKRETAQRHTLKIIAGFFAISLWYYVLNSEAIEMEKKLPINFNLPKGMSLVSPTPKELILKVRGSKAFIKNIFLNKEKFNIDLTTYYRPEEHLNEKSFKVKIYPTDINVPFGVSILEISPKEIAIELDHKALKEVPIKIQYVGNLPASRKLKEINLSPDKIMVAGPMELLRSINSFDTVPVNLSQLNKDEGTLTATLVEFDSRIKLEEPANFKIKFKTQQRIEYNNKIE